MGKEEQGKRERTLKTMSKPLKKMKRSGFALKRGFNVKVFQRTKT